MLTWLIFKGPVTNVTYVYSSLFYEINSANFCYKHMSGQKCVCPDYVGLCINNVRILFSVLLIGCLFSITYKTLFIKFCVYGKNSVLIV